MYNSGSDGREREAIAITLDRRIESLSDGVHLGLDLSQLRAGRYRVVVAATDPTNGASCRRDAELVVR